MNNTALEAILDVFIGMVFMWLVLSIATMSLQEWIASFLRWRAKDLETGIRRLLGNDPVWAEQLYAHPLIQGLTKKMGVKPSYIPSSKFALALFDIVMTAGTEQSYIQQQLLAAKREINKAPDEFVPFLAYLFRRVADSISGIIDHIRYFFGSRRGTGEQKFEELLRKIQDLFTENYSADPGEVQKKLKEFLLKVIDAETRLVTGKKVHVSIDGFFKEYPLFRDFILRLLTVALEQQPGMKRRWAEIIVHNDNKLLAKAQKELPEGQTLRGMLHEIVLEKGETLDLRQENLDLILLSIRRTIDEIDFSPVVAHIREQVGTVQGLKALKGLNPPLYKSLSELREDLVGLMSSSQIPEAVRARLATASAYVSAQEQKLAIMRLNSETWFNDSMDRLTGWYKRKATLLAFLVGLLLATILNVDSIGLAQHLWKEPAVRAALAANAAQFSNENPTIPTVPEDGNRFDNAVDYFNAQFAGLNIPLGWTYESVRLPADTACRFFPFGRNVTWGFRDNSVPNEARCMVISNAPANGSEWNLKIMGILFSAVAATQGSPFWFDILKKVVNIRASGKRPDEPQK